MTTHPRVARQQWASRSDWQAHLAITRTFTVIVSFAIFWIAAINLAFYAAVLREFAPELFQALNRVIVRGG